MLKNRLAPYILISVLIHTGLLFGVHSFLSLPDAQLEPPVLIPVEMVVHRKQPSASAVTITVSEPIDVKKQESTAPSQSAVAMDADQGSDDIADPIPAEGNYQSSLNLEANRPSPMMRMASKRINPVRQLEIVLSRTSPFHIFPADEQIFEVPPGPEKGDSSPRFTAGTIPTLFVSPTIPTGDEVASKPVELAIQESPLHLAAVEPSLPTWSPPSDISISADLFEAKAAVNPHYLPKGDEAASEPVELAIQESPLHLAAVEPSSPVGLPSSDVSASVDLKEINAEASPHFFLVSHKAVTSLVDVQAGDDFIAELRPLPKLVEGEPHLMASILEIQSHPSGAQVYVDGLLSGDTPLDMELTLGKHEVRLALPGHYDWKAQIKLTESNKSRPISFRLLPID